LSMAVLPPAGPCVGDGRDALHLILETKNLLSK
jgi:hypothetical protein